ncbi:MAG TPA: hypothetical protein VHN80_24120 [Kineosporiaceae bacterium]|nr:hypothetical protein [Kineosporiaceae bacterium]
MTLRGVDLAAVLGGSALGATILAGCVAFAADGPPLGYVRLALVALAAGAAYVLDEPAAAAVDAVPCTRRRRTAARATAVVAPYSVWAGGISALELRNAVTPVGSLLVEGAGVLALAVALAAGLRLAGHTQPGEIVASVLGAAVLAVLIFNPPPRSMPLFPVGDGWAASTALWSCLTVIAAALTIAASRDPYRR